MVSIPDPSFTSSFDFMPIELVSLVGSALPALFLYGSFLALFGVLTAPIGRVKLLIQCQDEMIKSGRLPKPYKGIVNCIARTISNEGFISLWKGYIPSAISDVSFRVNFQQFFLL